jgi:hypothetical protein
LVSIIAQALKMARDMGLEFDEPEAIEVQPVKEIE